MTLDELAIKYGSDNASACQHLHEIGKKFSYSQKRINELCEIVSRPWVEKSSPITLDELAIRHGTDKSSRCHSYTALYEQMFGDVRDEPLKILEIGVSEGASLRTWCDFFPNAEIHGIDINPDCKVFADDRITIHIGKQGDKDFLESIGIDFDIVIDDGSHQVSDQIFTFKCLWPNTKMVYVVEDVHTSYAPRYGGGYRRSGTAVEFFKDLVDDLNAPRLYRMYKSRGIHLGFKDIGTVQFYPSLICIYKGK